MEHNNVSPHPLPWPWNFWIFKLIFRNNLPDQRVYVPLYNVFDLIWVEEKALSVSPTKWMTLKNDHW